MSIIKNICEGSKPKVLSVLASLLDRIVARNEKREITSALLLSSTPNSKRLVIMTKFCSNEIPAMSIERFLERIYKYTQCSPSAFVVAYAYIDRLILSNPSFRITLLNVHRLLITSVMLATKFLDDLHYRNDHYAKIGGLTLKEINTLEVEFLFMMKFRMQVTVSVFQSYCSHLQREISLGGGFQIEQTLLHLSVKAPKPVGRQNHHSNKENKSTTTTKVPAFSSRKFTTHATTIKKFTPFSSTKFTLTSFTSPPLASSKKKQKLLLDMSRTYAGC